MALFVISKLILQTRIRSNPVGLDVCFLVRLFVYFHTSCVRTAKALVSRWRLAWAFAGRLCDKYLNLLMNWLNLFTENLFFCKRHLDENDSASVSKVLLTHYLWSFTVDRTSVCIWTTEDPKVRLLQSKTGLSPSVIYYWPFQGDASVVVCSNFQCSSAFCLSLTYCSIYLG